MENNSIDADMQSLILNYYNLYPSIQSVPVNVIVTDCLSETHFKLRPDLKERLIKEGFEKHNNDNGRAVFPRKVGDAINILLNSERKIEYTKDGSMTWIGTLAHELTHAIDYHTMALKEKLDSYDPLSEISENLMFQLWSEYHARKLGYRFLREELGADDCDEKERVDHIIRKELPFHIDYLYKQYHNTTDGISQMYQIMQFLGRLSVWCDLFPETFKKNTIDEIFVDASWMHNIFYFLKQFDSLDTVYLRFEDMRLLLKENWNWL